MRISGYDIYPGNNQILSNNSVFIKSKNFNYLNQGNTTNLVINHTVGKPRLFMVWAADLYKPALKTQFWLTTYEDNQSLVPLPNATYIYRFRNPGFDTMYYDSKFVAANNNTLTLTASMFDDFPSDVYRDYYHIILFEDSFDAPFVYAELV